MPNLTQTDPEIAEIIANEKNRQQNGLEMIASENYTSDAVLEANGSILTNKYSEGYPNNRYYSGQKYIDEMELLAINRAKTLFGAEHANIQPLSGSSANMAAYMAVLNIGDKILGMELSHGGHLTHGHPLSFSGKTYKIATYGVNKNTEKIDMKEVRKIAKKEKPKMIIAGFSAYSHHLDWQSFRDIANETGAILLADIAHTAGLIAGKVIPNPTPYCDIITTTTHKTLRGPRGGMILCKQKYAKAIDKAVFPGTQGGPHNHTNAAKAIALHEANQPDFHTYAQQILDNASTLANELAKLGYRIISKTTENHIIIIDTYTSTGLTGSQAQKLLEQANIYTNKNMIPYDTRHPLDPSGIRLGTPAITTRGYTTKHMPQIASWIHRALNSKNNTQEQTNIRTEIHKINQQIKQ